MPAEAILDFGGSRLTVSFLCTCGSHQSLFNTQSPAVTCRNCGAGWLMGEKLSTHRGPPVAAPEPSVTYHPAEPAEVVDSLLDAEPAMGIDEMFQPEYRAPTPPRHPGELLAQVRASHELSAKELAAKLYSRPDYIERLEDGKSNVTPDFAMRLQRLFGVPAESWLMLQMQWDLQPERVDAKIMKIEPLAEAG